MVRAVGTNLNTTRAPRDDPNGVIAEELPADGRAARAVKTRAAIVDALLDLLEEGDLQPTATRIAERAGISLRLIYHHFGDLESLFELAASRQTARIRAMVRPIDPLLPVTDRVEALVTRRSEMLEWGTPVRKASLLQEPFSEELRTARDSLFALGRYEVAEVLSPELAAAPEHERELLFEALGTTLSWGFWNDLRESGHDADAARAIVLLAVGRLLGI